MQILTFPVSTSLAIHRDPSPLWAWYYPIAVIEMEGWIREPYQTV